MRAGDWISVEDRLPKIGERVMVCQQFNDGSTFARMATRVQINQTNRWYDDEGVTTDYFQESICEWLHEHHYNDESDTYDEGFDPDVMSYHEIVLNIIKELESKQ